jgi:hypothetical protein
MSILTSSDAARDIPLVVSDIRSKGVTDEAEQHARMVIVEMAIMQAMAGAHYHRGVAGAVPNGSGPLAGPRLAYVNDGDWPSIALHCGGSSFARLPSPIRCLGRYRHPDLGGAGCELTGRDGPLRRHIEAQSARRLEPALWDSFHGLYPRRIMDEDAQSHVPPPPPPDPETGDPTHDPYGGVRRFFGRLFLGEDCQGKQHFDCIGLVRYVRFSLGGGDLRISIAQVRDGGSWWARSVALPRNPATLMPGDVLTRSTHHIGFVGVNGHVIDAFGEENGVVVRSYDSGSWDRVCHLKADAIAELSGAALATASH